MYSIQLSNVQAIESATIDFEDNSIVEFIGDNSNGKSIISKVIQNMTSGDIRHKDVRASLIRDGADKGVVIFTHNEKRLGLVMFHEISNSVIIYQSDWRDEETTIVRNLSDVEGSNALIREFGFRTYAQGDICLQLAPTFGAIPFITTNGSVNNDIVQDITVDKVAEEFLSTYKTITYPLFKDRKQKLVQQNATYQSLLDNLETYDWRAYEDIVSRMSEVYMALKDISPLEEIKEIPIPPLDVIPAGSHQIETIPIVEFYDYCPEILSLENELNEYLQISNGVCPTCGKALF